MRYLGETLDNLACVMMGLRDWPPRDELIRCYQAARQHARGAPITYQMGKALLQAIANNKTVILVTGEYERGLFDKGESDGPVGIAAIASVLHKLGARLVFVCDPHLFDVHRAIVDCFMGTSLEYVPFPGGAETDYELLATEILEKYNPSAIIACEKLGRNIVGEYHNADGRNCSADENRVDYLFDLAYEQGCLTIAFGDHGNEIGYGIIRDVAVDASPWGRNCRCSCDSGIIAVTKVTYLLPTTVSNWGAIALADMLAALSGRVEWVHTEECQRRLQELILENEVIDGAFLRVSRSVDGIDGDVDLAVVKVMEAATTRSLMTQQELFGDSRKIS